MPARCANTLKHFCRWVPYLLSFRLSTNCLRFDIVRVSESYPLHIMQSVVNGKTVANIKHPLNYTVCSINTSRQSLGVPTFVVTFSRHCCTPALRGEGSTVAPPTEGLGFYKWIFRPWCQMVIVCQPLQILSIYCILSLYLDDFTLKPHPFNFVQPYWNRPFSPQKSPGFQGTSISSTPQRWHPHSPASQWAPTGYPRAAFVPPWSSTTRGKPCAFCKIYEILEHNTQTHTHTHIFGMSVYACVYMHIMC